MKTRVELRQAINNRLMQGEDASDLLQQLKDYPKETTTYTTIKHSDEEKKAIMMFNGDKRFTITE
jgi:hypothetical protein